MTDDFTISQYDMEILREQQKDAERRHRRQMERIRYTSYAVGWASLAAAIVGVAWIIWQATAGLSATEQAEDRKEQACIAEHGTWLLLDRGNRSAPDGTCVFGEVGP